MHGKNRNDMKDDVLGAMINDLIEFGKGHNHEPFDMTKIHDICQQLKRILAEQSLLLQLFAPIKVVGSIHGHFKELIKLFEFCGWPSQGSYLFLGNYVDKGPNSLETILLLFLFKLRYPTTFFLLRGAHESAYTNTLYGKNKCGYDNWKLICQVFNYLPFAAVVQQKIFCVSGGISPQLDHLSQIEKLQRTQIPKTGLACDLVWAGINKNEYGFENNIGGFGMTFGRDCLDRFLVNNDLQLLVRSRSVVENGFEFEFEKSIINLWSAPLFLGKFNNYAAVLHISGELTCEFQVLKLEYTYGSLSDLIDPS